MLVQVEVECKLNDHGPILTNDAQPTLLTYIKHVLHISEAYKAILCSYIYIHIWELSYHLSFVFSKAFSIYISISKETL